MPEVWVTRSSFLKGAKHLAPVENSQADQGTETALPLALGLKPQLLRDYTEGTIGMSQLTPVPTAGGSEPPERLGETGQ